MEFHVIPKKKSQIANLYLHSSAKLNSLLAISRACLLITALLLTLNILLSKFVPTWMASEIEGSMVKHDKVILIVNVSIAVIGVAVFILLKLNLRRNVAANLMERSEEVIRIEDGALVYHFYQTYSWTDTEKSYGGADGAYVDVRLPFDRTHELIYDQQTKKLTFRGNFLCQYKEDYGYKGKGQSSKWKKEFIIFDYFNPSLTEAIVNHFKKEGNVHMSTKLWNMEEF